MTLYKGVEFASRIEARWAVFFDALGVQWEQYPAWVDGEPISFWLPDVSAVTGHIGCYVDIRDLITDDRIEDARRVVSESGRDVVLFRGTPTRFLHSDQHSGLRGEAVVTHILAVPGERSDSGEVLNVKHEIVSCGLHSFTIINDRPHIRILTEEPWRRGHRHPRIVAALEKANTFYFGSQKGRAA